MILLIGDIHCNFDYIKYQVKQKQLTDCFIIQVGDFGIGFNIMDDESMRDLNEFLSSRNIILYAIRGNHDDPFYFKGNHIFSNVKLLPDYTQLEIDGHNILFVGGATSVDRKKNLTKMQIAASLGKKLELYWFDEGFVLDEERLKDIKGVDVVITHTAPEWCWPDNRVLGINNFVMSFAVDDDNLVEDLRIERELVSKMFRILKDNGNMIDKHFYGHFHKSEITLNGYTTHTLLDVNEVKVMDQYTDEEYEKIFK